MRIAVTGDNHLDFLRDGESLVRSMMGDMAARKASVVLNLGDMTNGRLYDKYRGLDELLGDQFVLYVVGNHDIWSPSFCKARRPNEAFRQVVGKWRAHAARPLERSFSDRETLWRSEEHDVAIVGTMGFPDFEHPKHHMPKAYYESRHFTNDGSYMDLSLGWLRHTRRIKASFAARLGRALEFGHRDLVVATHYPIFEGQYRLDGSDISAYFFCHGIGRHVLEVAKAHPGVRFWCFAAHAHEYCKGRMSVEADNVVSYGLEADYGRLTFAVFDTGKGFDQDVETAWLPGKPYVPVIESVTRDSRGTP